MYRKTDKTNQYDIFSQVHHHLQENSYKQYVDPEAWHNQFRRHVFNLIDEIPFRVLFNEKMGAPNASIRRLIAMMILKEAFGWSDLQLFERCRFDLRVRSAIGLDNLNDPVPGDSTYYLLRKRMYKHYINTGQDLMNEVFQSITFQQIQEFEVEGQHVRMDSKLIGSNIAFYSRYEIIHQSLALFYKKLGKTDRQKLSLNQTEQLEKIASQKGEKVVFKNNKQTINERLQDLGQLIWQILQLFKGSQMKYYQILEQIFKEQYSITDDQKIQLRPKEEIAADSIQTPHDTDCSNRKKNNQEVKGYSYNITEINDNDPDNLNLITDLQVDKAGTPDNEFFQPAIEQTTKILSNTPKNAYTDGAYNSSSNSQYCNKNLISFYLTGMQGSQGQYELNPTEQGLQVIDRNTGEQFEATLIKNNKWRIKTEKGYRYFTNQQIENCQKRKEIQQLPIEITNRRNNVEATMFLLSVHLRNNKSKYRGLLKQKMWALARCLWINLVRIIKYMGKVCQRTSKTMKYSQILIKNRLNQALNHQISLISIIIDKKSVILFINCQLFRFGLNKKLVF